MTSFFRITALAAGLAAISGPAAAAEVAWQPYGLKLRSGQTLDAEVGALSVPLRHARPDGAKTTLRFVRLASTGRKGAAPIVYLAGGPGGSGIASAQGERWPMFEALRREGDVILLDQRGVGLSDAPPPCTRPLELPLDQPSTEASLARAMQAHTAACAAEWRAKGVDLGAYNTADNAADVADLAHALGGKVRLVAISYGTFLAFAVLRDHSDLVDRVVLAGTEGPDQTLKPPTQADDMLAKLSRRTAADPVASKMTPDLEHSMRAVLARLDQAPVWGETKGPDGKPVRVLISKYDVQAAIAFMLGTTPNAARVPALVAAMEHGQFGPMAGLVMMMRRFISSADAMALATDAASTVSPERERRIAAETRRSLFGNAINVTNVDLAGALGVQRLAARWRAPLRTTVPALFISGDLDGRTPPANAEEVRKGFRTSGHLVLEGAGHDNDLFLSSPLIIERMTGFLRGDPPRDETIKVDVLKFSGPGGP